MAEYFASRSPEISRREKAHMEAVRALAGECMVLLENNGALPLGAPGGEDIHKLALYGNGARHTVKGGTGSGDVNSRMVVTIEEGLKNAGFTITTERWLDNYDSCYADAQKAYLEQVMEIAEEKKVPPFLVTFEMPFREPQIPAVTPEEAASPVPIRIPPFTSLPGTPAKARTGRRRKGIICFPHQSWRLWPRWARLIKNVLWCSM